jgi:hypothetical protein
MTPIDIRSSMKVSLDGQKPGAARQAAAARHFFG